MSEVIIWQDLVSNLSVTEGEDGLLISDGVNDIAVAREAALAMARSIIGRQAQPVTPKGTYYQVFYAHEYCDGDGNMVPCPELGEHDGEWRFTRDAATLEETVVYAKEIGKAIENLHDFRIKSGLSTDQDNERAWLSVFEMPTDERLWKGHWDELEWDIRNLETANDLS